MRENFVIIYLGINKCPQNNIVQFVYFIYLLDINTNEHIFN